MGVMRVVAEVVLEELLVALFQGANPGWDYLLVVGCSHYVDPVRGWWQLA